MARTTDPDLDPDVARRTVPHEAAARQAGREPGDVDPRNMERGTGLRDIDPRPEPAPERAPVQAPEQAPEWQPERVQVREPEQGDHPYSEQDPSSEPEPFLERPRRRRRRFRKLKWTVGVGLLTASSAAAGVAGGYWFAGRDQDSGAASGAPLPATTTEVARKTLTAAEAFTGTLGHGDAFTVTSAGQGVVTRLAEADTDVKRGTTLFRLNERPVTALIGGVPMYRDLRPGAEGLDVKQLERNLAELGYINYEADQEFESETADAVRAWQDDLGLPETGVVAQSDVVFLPEAGRVETTRTDVGSRVMPGAAVLDVTSRDHVASLEAELEDRDLLAVGSKVEVLLPDGEEVPGTVTGAEAGPGGVGGGEGDDSEAGGGEGEDTVVTVEVTLQDPVDESLLGSSVDVEVDVDNREDVLVVPVNALLALSDGGYGLEVVKNGKASTVPVETGLFAHGEVEVEGKGIGEGTIVGVAGR